jgi:hypothetical protein
MLGTRPDLRPTRGSSGRRMEPDRSSCYNNATPWTPCATVSSPTLPLRASTPHLFACEPAAARPPTALKSVPHPSPPLWPCLCGRVDEAAGAVPVPVAVCSGYLSPGRARSASARLVCCLGGDASGSTASGTGRARPVQRAAGRSAGAGVVPRRPGARSPACPRSPSLAHPASRAPVCRASRVLGQGTCPRFRQKPSRASAAHL